MVYMTIDDLVFDHLSGHLPSTLAPKAAQLPLARPTAIEPESSDPKPTSERPCRFDIIDVSVNMI
jgi:hypothetical protein